MAVAILVPALVIVRQIQPVVVAGLWLFGAASNILEPDLITGLAPADTSGTGLGIEASTTFAGDVLGDWLHGAAGEAALLSACAALALAWIAIAPGRCARDGGEDAITGVGSPS